MLHERRGDDTGQHVVDRRLHVAFGDERERLLARGDELGCVGGHGELEDRRLPGLGEPARDRAPDRVELDDLDLADSRRLGGTGPAGSRAALDVFGNDPPVRSCPTERGELDPALPRDPAGERACLHPSPSFRGRRSAPWSTRLAFHGSAL